ncbi:hypothetical protein [Nibricoccus aquaticus]|uniref:hypothetical protein n=1 Tax=Nibricoccus aquaticus TaxID=2576891 RepID=UPI0010FD474D|nr:hypothetical protein [Nibricoccus aquaticus]
MNKYFDEIRKAIQATHRCDAVHMESVHVTQSLAGKTAWDGEVEAFKMGDSSKANVCFAWGSQNAQSGRWNIYYGIGHRPRPDRS